jgi:hypothetical protein
MILVIVRNRVMSVLSQKKAMSLMLPGSYLAHCIEVMVTRLMRADVFSRECKATITIKHFTHMRDVPRLWPTCNIHKVRHITAQVLKALITGVIQFRILKDESTQVLIPLLQVADVVVLKHHTDFIYLVKSHQLSLHQNILHGNHDVYTCGILCLAQCGLTRRCTVMVNLLLTRVLGTLHVLLNV